ncbi:penicillin-binding protein [Bacillus cereus]|nr:penicillin-binding protein [Bacillus cereus]
MKIDNNPFTANKITIILVSKPISAANIFIVRHGELVL